MSQTSNYYSAIKDFLRETYGIKHVDILRKSRHPRGRFLYNGKVRDITLHNSVSGGAKDLDIKKRDIVQLLGPPPPKPEPKPRQKLEEMLGPLPTPYEPKPEKYNIPDIPRIEYASEPTAPEVKEPEMPAVEPNKVFVPKTKPAPDPVIGRIAIYEDRIKFLVPRNLGNVGIGNGYRAERDGPDQWTLHKAASPRILSDRTLSYYGTTGEKLRGDLPICGPSPAEFLVVDNTIVVRLLLDQVQPHGNTPANRLTPVPPRVVQPQVWVGVTEVPTTPAIVKPLEEEKVALPEIIRSGPHIVSGVHTATAEEFKISPEEEMRTALAEVRRIEATTTYRIVRTEKGTLAFVAPTIE
jgi:hypothetical protein